MSVVETIKSREQQISQRAERITRVYAFDTVSDWENWIANGYPKLGDYLSKSRTDLRVVNIRNRWVSQGKGFVYVDYSNRGLRYRNSYPNTYQSLQEDIDVSENPIQLDEDDTYYNMETSFEGNFLLPYVKKWDADHTGFDAGEVPSIPPTFAARMVVNIKQNQAGWDYTKVRSALGCVNSEIFLPHYIDTYYGGQYRNIHKDYRINYGASAPDDTGFWLFTHFTAHNTGDGNWELHYQFENSGYWAWNNPYDIETYLYLTYDFNSLPFPTRNLNNLNMTEVLPGR